MFSLIVRAFWAVFDFCMHPLLTEGGRKRQEAQWIKEAREAGATHIVERFDSFKIDSFPYFVMPSEDVNKVAARYRTGRGFLLGRIIEVP